MLNGVIDRQSVFFICRIAEIAYSFLSILSAEYKSL